MEQVIVKTVSAFLNSDGGTLLIGVADDGTPLGLDPRLRDVFEGARRRPLRALAARSPDHHARAEHGGGRRDHRRIGRAARGLGTVPVCRVTCSPSPRPVYLRAGNNPPEFWVRAGNSTRQLTVDAAADYVMHRWPLGAGRAIAAQIRAAIRFSAG